MTRIGQKWRGGTPKPEPGDKGFSDVWWISQEVDKDRNVQLRQEAIAKLLEDANRYDSCGMSEYAIREARSALTIMPRKNSTYRTSACRPRSQSQLGPRSTGRGRELDTQCQEEADDHVLNEALPPRPHTRQGDVGRHDIVARHASGQIFKSSAGGERVSSESAGRRGWIGTSGKYVPHFRLAGRPKTAAQPMREGWGSGQLVFPQKIKAEQAAGEGESIYDLWQQTSWAKTKRYHVCRSDVRSPHFNRLRYGVKVPQELPPESAISGSHSFDPATAAPPSWVRKGSLISGPSLLHPFAMSKCFLI